VSEGKHSWVSAETGDGFVGGGYCRRGDEVPLPKLGIGFVKGWRLGGGGVVKLAALLFICYSGPR